MRKSLFFLIFLLPAISFAQLNRITPGMSLAELQKLYPTIKPDLTGMTSNIYGDDVLNELPGKGTWIIMRDTLRSYLFSSKDVLGPCEKFNNADSAKNHLLMRKAKELELFFESAFGKATTTTHPRSTDGAIYLYYSKWAVGDDEVILSVARPFYSSSVDNQINAPNPGIHGSTDIQPKGIYDCYYKLALHIEGKKEILRTKFGVGESKAEFKKHHPQLSGQVLDFPDKWTMRDTLQTNYGNWRFSFVNGKLTAFSLDIYDGSIYKNQTERAYSILLDRCHSLTREARKNYGKPDEITSPPSNKYQPQNMQLYYSRIDYQANWNNVDGKKMVVRLGETGGGKQGAPVFHLEVIYPAL